MRQSLIQLHLPDDQACAGRTGSFAQQIRATAYFSAEFSFARVLTELFREVGYSVGHIVGRDEAIFLLASME